MARGHCTFRQQDVTRAIRAAFAAGATRAQIQIGGITITAEKTNTGNAMVSATEPINEWDLSLGGEKSP
jgi:hypothetical protein